MFAKGEKDRTQGVCMEFYFSPLDETEFKNQAQSNFIKTIILDTEKKEIVNSYYRHVRKIWGQTCKNYKELTGEHFQIYSRLLIL